MLRKTEDGLLFTTVDHNISVEPADVDEEDADEDDADEKKGLTTRGRTSELMKLVAVARNGAKSVMRNNEGDLKKDAESIFAFQRAWARIRQMR